MKYLNLNLLLLFIPATSVLIKKIKLKQSTWSFSIPREGFTGDVLGLTTGEPEEDPALGTGSGRVG